MSCSNETASKSKRETLIGKTESKITERVKVSVRIRPSRDNELSCMKVLTTSDDVNVLPKRLLCNNQTYDYDAVFDSSSSNEFVYNNSGAEGIVKVSCDEHRIHLSSLLILF